jgi:hypothetical protein
MDGSRKEVENACKSIVDVRDVAEAHMAWLSIRASAAPLRCM